VNFGFGFGGWGRVGWLPCGPGDWFHPWYGGWGGRYRVVGVGEFGRFHEGFSPLGRGGRFSNFDEAFRNERVRGGFSSMGGNEFGRGAVSMHQERISEASFRQSTAMTGRMPVNPSRESFRPSNREASPSTIRGGSFGSQRFFSSNRAGFAAGTENRGNSGFGGNRNEAFGNNRSGWSANGRGFEGNSSGNRGGFERPSSNANPVNRGNFGRGAPNGWHSFTAPQGGNANRGGESSANGNNRGAENRGSFSPSERQSNQGGFNRFTPPSRGESQPQSTMRNYQSQRQFDSPNTASRGGYGGSSNSYNRPPLNMRQPIVTPRGGYNESSRGTYGGGYNNSRGGGYSMPRGGNSGGGYSAPRGNYSAPQGGGGYRGNSGGGGNRGGGGSSQGNGGGHSGHR
jgi:hypothetical protein